MTEYLKMNAEQLQKEHDIIKKKYDDLCDMDLHLDMARGKPSPEQMDISMGMFDYLSKEKGYKNHDGIDCRNYGGLDGLSELKELFSQLMTVEPDQIIVGGNSSLNMMYDTVSQAMTHGFGGCEPWLKQDGIKFICPVPGYDRHFSICEYFGIEMVSVPLKNDGPDMDIVEELIKDESVKGMWCVPKYSNPNGIVYSDEIIKRIAAMKPKAKDFRIFWDNAYTIHHLTEKKNTIISIYEECEKAGNPDMPIIFTSTSKITFPGAGVAAEASSPKNVLELKHRMSYQTIGPNKLNQLQHARMFPNIGVLEHHMEKHAAILYPKFQVVLKGLAEGLDGTGIAEWTNPEGGYFISLNVLKGCAKRTVKLCKSAGLILTKAGATYPYGIDPDDSNIRIAPSYPSIEELKIATELLCVSAKLAVLEKIMNIR